jgi:hypothetical protein
MLTKLQNRFQIRWRRFYISIFPESPAFDAEEQKRLTWARIIESYDALPDVYKPFFDPFLTERRVFPYVVLTPTYEGFLDRTTEKLICSFDDDIHILERIGNTVKVYCYPLYDITFIELNTILLESWIKIVGITKNGVPASTSIKFNTATDYLFTPILEKIRLAAMESEDLVWIQDPKIFDYLERANYKFMNYARRSLLRGEKVLQIILQSKIQAHILTFLGRSFFRTISPAHMSILTDRELIIIQEEDRHLRIDEYGEIWKYIPLRKIANLSLTKKDDNHLVLSIQLNKGMRIDHTFQASAKQEIQQLLTKLAELTAN